MGHLTDFENTIFENNFELQDALPADVDFGSPKKKDCPNFGICRINYWTGSAFNLIPSCCPNKAVGHIRRWQQHGIELIFSKKNMQQATFEKHFGSGWFTVEDAYQLPPEMAEKLDIPSFSFEPGSYPVLEMEGRMHVVFD